MVPRALANHKNLRLTFRLAGNWLNPIGLLHSSERPFGEPPWDVRNVLYPSRSIPPDYRSWNFIPNREHDALRFCSFWILHNTTFDFRISAVFDLS